MSDYNIVLYETACDTCSLLWYDQATLAGVCGGQNMEQSVLEMAKELVVVQVGVYRLGPETAREALRSTHAKLMMLRRQEETRGVGREAPREPVDWRRNITRQTVTCLECGAVFKQLSGRHLEGHGLDRRSYRAKYGIPRTQALMARDISERRRRVAQRVRMWEKALGYRGDRRRSRGLGGT